MTQEQYTLLIAAIVIYVVAHYLIKLTRPYYQKSDNVLKWNIIILFTIIKLLGFFCLALFIKTFF